MFHAMPCYIFLKKVGMFALLKFQAKRCWYRCVKPVDIITRLRGKKARTLKERRRVSMQKGDLIHNKKMCPTKEQTKEDVSAT